MKIQNLRILTKAPHKMIMTNKHIQNKVQKYFFICLVTLTALLTGSIMRGSAELSENISSSKNLNKSSFSYRLLDLTNTCEIEAVYNLLSNDEILEIMETTKEGINIFLKLLQPGKKYDNWKVYIALNGQNKICGCMAYTDGDAALSGSGVTTINYLAVAHDYRRQKIATGLVQRLQEDCPHITALNTYVRNYSEAKNANAMAFFRQNGFTEFEKNKGMRKALGDCQDHLALPANPKIEIKIVNKNDAQEIKSLAELFVDKEIQAVIDWRPESILANAQGFDDLVYIAKDSNGTVCGTLMAVIDGESIATSSKLIICTVATHQAYRNQGIATLLLEKIEQACLLKNLKQLELWVISENEKAVRCYQRAGFAEFANSIGLIKKLNSH